MTKVVVPAGIDKNKVRAELLKLFDALWEEHPEDEYAAELVLIPVVMAIGRLLMTALLARRCYEVAMSEIVERGFDAETWRFRLDRSYRSKLATTFGVIAVIRFAYRYEKNGVWVTRTPTAVVLPMHPYCRSSTALLRVELALGCRMPFREAQGVMGLIAGDEAAVHDTTISEHLRVVSSVVDRTWSYQSVDKITAIVAERAVLDQVSGQPLLFFSSDGHAELFYEDGLWAVSPKMVNGIRIWTVDRYTGKPISIGGEFIFGDCHAVAAAFDDLDAKGILPFNGKWGDVQAQLVFIADGMPWFDDHIAAKFDNLGRVLDAYHVLERLAKYVAKVFDAPANTAAKLKAKLKKASKKALADLRELVIGKVVRKKTPPQKERHKAGAGDQGKGGKTPKRRKVEAYDVEREFPWFSQSRLKEMGLPPNVAGELVARIRALPTRKELADDLKGLEKYLANRFEAIAYATAWKRGWPLSSAPMESFNRVAQVRLKRPGATWTVEAAEAVMKVRLMHVYKRDDEFWRNPKIRRLVADAFAQKKVA